MNKKGDIQDVFLIAVTIFVLGLVILLVYQISDKLNTKFDEKEEIPSEGKAAMSRINNMFPGILDDSFLFIIVFFAIAAFALASLVRVHPVFFVPYVIVLIIVIILCGIFSNVYSEAAAHPEYTALADRLTFISLTLNYLPFIVGIIGFILAIIMFKYWREGR